jgi:hypothetical protein
MPLKVDGPATQDTLKELETDDVNSFEATVDEKGIEAEVSHETKSGWSLAAYVRRLWSGNTSAGARVRKTF